MLGMVQYYNKGTQMHFSVRRTWQITAIELKIIFTFILFQNI